MTKIFSLVLTVLIFAGSSSMAQVDANVEALNLYVSQLKGDLVQKRDSAMTHMIDLEGEQSKAFWKILRQYDKAAKKIRKERLAMLREFVRISDGISDEKSTELAERAFTIAENRIALRREYFERVSDEISPVVAVRFLQLQTQFETMADSKIAAMLPLAGS